MQPQIQKIIENLQNLDSSQLSKVLGFVEFIYRERETALPEAAVINELYGKYRDRLSSSEEFARRKQEEINLEEKKWQVK